MPDPEFQRWICPFEFVLMQGFPVYNVAKLSSLDVACFDAMPLANFGGRHVAEQSGNAMPTLMISVPILWAWCCTAIGDINSDNGGDSVSDNVGLSDRHLRGPSQDRRDFAELLRSEKRRRAAGA